MREHDWEPVPGLPERLPAGEHVLWQGAPRWSVLASRAFHLRTLAVYLGALWLWLAATTVTGGPLTWHAAGLVAANFGLACVALGLVALFCYMTQRSTMYTVTNRRMVIRFGIALPLTLNIPFNLIAAAGVKANKDGQGDITLSLLPGKRITYLVMWPHVRPWKMTRPEPMLRGLPDAIQAAQILSRALAAASSQAAPALPAAVRGGANTGRAAAAA